MTNSHENRFSTLEAESSRNTIEIEKLWQNVDRRNQNHTEVMSTLAVIVNKQDDFKAYTTECETERKELNNRVNVIEGHQKTQKAIMLALASVGSAFGTVIGFFFRH